MPKHPRRGQIDILSLIISSVLFTATFAAFISIYQSTNKTLLRNQHSLIAEGYAIELLEFFRSQPSSFLISNYLTRNPVTGSTVAANLYPYCAHINLLDRTGNKVLNADPLASTPSTSPLTNLNRYYQVFVVDETNLAVDYSKCSTTPGAALGATQALLVSVGVSWEENPGNILQVSLTAMLPKS